jgi:AraC-like DNA-binding protein/mannose-6-phosphate isomerase-like protein (cupin superfamily)
MSEEKQVGADKLRKQYEPQKSKPLRFNTKVLYAGKLQRAKQWSGNYHVHEFLEVVFVLEGSGEILIDGEYVNVEKGDIVIYPPNMRHSEHTKQESKDPLELAFFGVTGLKLNNLEPDRLLPDGESPVVHTGEDEGRFRWLFETVFSEVENSKPYGEMMVDLYVKLILTEILRKVEVEERMLIKNAAFSEIYNYIANHYTEINTIDDICEKLYVNRYYVSHVFKKYTGVSPMNYVTKCRMTLAKKLLEETNLSASEISRRCGYFDTTNFFRNFKNNEKMTPIEYRESKKKRK